MPAMIVDQAFELITIGWALWLEWYADPDWPLALVTPVTADLARAA